MEMPEGWKRFFSSGSINANDFAIACNLMKELAEVLEEGPVRKHARCLCSLIRGETCWSCMNPQYDYSKKEAVLKKFKEWK